MRDNEDRPSLAEVTDDYHDLWPRHAGQPWCGEGECRRCALEQEEEEERAEVSPDPTTWPGNDAMIWKAEDS